MYEFLAKKDDIKKYYDDILKLNEELVELLSPMDFDRMKWLEEMSDIFMVAVYKGEFAGFLIALCDGKPYDSVNYRWFSDNYKNFLYVDRIVIKKDMQSKGIGTNFYKELYKVAKEKDFNYITAEINSKPPNEQSLSFHKKAGFNEVSEQEIKKGKFVSMQVKDLN